MHDGVQVIRLATFLLCALLTIVPARAQPAFSSETDAGNAARAYSDLINRFWEGAASTGHLTRYATGLPLPSGAPTETSICIGCFWEYGQGINALYAHWKLNGSVDAQTRLKAVWRWTQVYISLTNAGTCGPVAGSNGTAQDDIAWNANAYLQLYEASGDANALAYAKASLDCAWGRWYDTTTGGGLWYDDSHSEKSSYQAPYAWALLRYAELASDTTYRDKAVALDTWASTVLSRSDGLYWEGVAPSGVPLGNGNPNGITKAGSVVFLAGNMAWAALDARLYALTGTASYQARATATAAGIYAKERIGTVLMDDRDAYTNGWSAYVYTTQVLPLLTASNTADAKTLIATSRSVMRNARNTDGSFSGDWDGAPIKWSGSPAYTLKVTANALIWAIVAASLPGATK